MTKFLFHVDLRRLILWMCFFFVALALANSFYAAYQVQREVLMENTLESNRVYAQKLAHITDAYIRSSRLLLEGAASDLADQALTSQRTQATLQRLANMTAGFNSLFVAAASGVAIAGVPANLDVIGTTIQAPQIAQILAMCRPYITAPFRRADNNWIVMITQPILDKDDHCRGYIAGTIYLHEANALRSALGNHFYKDNSYLYVVDQTGNVIYHPELSQIGTSKLDNLSVQAALRGERGALRLTTENGIDVLAGYAPVASTGWGIVAQRPTQAALAGLGGLFWQAFYYSVPISLLSLLAIGWLSKFIARPLTDLAEVASNLDNRANFARIRYIKGWYHEASLLREALLTGFSAVALRLRRLHQENTTDPLTAVTNRRGLDAALTVLSQDRVPVALVLFDIDHFKVVNDTYGHAAGDEVLKTIASVTVEQVRETDIIARLGGEEFVVVLPNATPESALLFAERLRFSIEHTDFSPCGKITVSLGIAQYPTDAHSVGAALKLADAALYKAKKDGRNCTRQASELA
ncbi:sensor domain-containing diguanylate cyclase [Pusillimonas sp. SM2304]|uniref:GGDEF domain-containing protein n=1 Tax=Pusillimonas sp. SM2304 TaxID=3073241 RepID=UPI0028748D7D|nr:sensor domain-containing diguanylate cyclase [Pusillimonas sp. SM2304]MDS1139137.1 sensor domain-containing diguanylate cyclase [Pusillimonas sp. SM2304]